MKALVCGDCKILLNLEIQEGALRKQKPRPHELPFHAAITKRLTTPYHNTTQDEQ
jgi:hypothetical protein